MAHPNVHPPVRAPAFRRASTLAIALALALATALTGTACGGGGAASGGGRDDAERTEGGEAGPSHAERAVDALARGALDEAARHADQALQLDPTDRAAKEVAARVAFAEGDVDRVIEVLTGETGPVLVRLRARAFARRGDLAATAEALASVDGQEPADGWAAAMLPIARAAAGKTPYAVEGAPRASLPFVGRAPVPVVEIAIDGRTANALVATSADLTVVDTRVRATAGLASTVALGPITMRDVPVITRDLGPIGEQLGVRVDAVLGVDVLLRFATTIDFRERWVVVRREGSEASADAPSAPFATLGGFLAVQATFDGDVTGWVTLDTAGVFPVALTDDAVTALGHDLATLETAPNAPSDTIKLLTLERIRIGNVEIAHVPAATGLIPRDLTDLAGVPHSGILGAGLLQQMRLTLTPHPPRLHFD